MQEEPELVRACPHAGGAVGSQVELFSRFSISAR
jgi:hypothetical protein